MCLWKAISWMRETSLIQLIQVDLALRHTNRGQCNLKLIQIKFNQIQVFGERGIPEHPGENLSEQRREPTSSTHIMIPTLGIERGPHWWEASALTSMPPLLSFYSFANLRKLKGNIGHVWWSLVLFFATGLSKWSVDLSRRWPNLVSCVTGVWSAVIPDPL